MAMMFTLGKCDYSVSKSSNSAFFFNDKNYKWASNNSAHMNTVNTVLAWFIVNKRTFPDPSKSRPMTFL